MDYGAIRRKYGCDLVLCASLSSQHMLPFGTPAEIRAWVAAMRALCAADNRAIFCPSNLIQPETPWENLVAFADAAKLRSCA